MYNITREFTPEDWELFNRKHIYFEHFADDSEPIMAEVTCSDGKQLSLVADGAGITFVQYLDKGLETLQLEADPDQWDQYEAQVRLEGLTSLYEQSTYGSAIMHFEYLVTEGL